MTKQSPTYAIIPKEQKGENIVHPVMLIYKKQTAIQAIKTINTIGEYYLAKVVKAEEGYRVI